MHLLESYTINIFWHFLKILASTEIFIFFCWLAQAKYVAILIVSINFSIDTKNLSFGWPMVKITYIDPTWLFWFRKRATLHDYSILHVYTSAQSKYYVLT